MDIAALSMSLANMKLSQSAGVSMMCKAKEQMESQGQQIAEMIQSAEVKVGSGIDIKL